MQTQHPPTIALVDLDAFYASVEVIENPILAGKPLLIGGDPASRGVVAAASYEARQFGCHSAMPMAQAVRLCPEATILRPRFVLYREYSDRVMNSLKQESAIVEQVSIDEAYVDLSSPTKVNISQTALARRLQGIIRIEHLLPCSVGMGTSKMISKIACEVAKPGGVLTVPAGQERSFLKPLPISIMPGIGPQTSQRLASLGLTTLGQLADCPSRELAVVIGPRSAILQERARGIDRSKLKTTREIKSISSEETFVSDISDKAVLADQVMAACGQLADQMKERNLVCRTVTLKLRMANFDTVTRAESWDYATGDPDVISHHANHLLDVNWEADMQVRLVGVAVSNLRPLRNPAQLSLGNLST